MAVCSPDFTPDPRDTIDSPGATDRFLSWQFGVDDLLLSLFDGPSIENAPFLIYFASAVTTKTSSSHCEAVSCRYVSLQHTCHRLFRPCLHQCLYIEDSTLLLLFFFLHFLLLLSFGHFISE